MNGNKSKYVLDYKDLQLYFSLGLNLVVVYRILKFKQSDWLKITLILIWAEEKNLLIVLEEIF